MHKRLATVSCFQLAFRDAIVGWFSQFHDWNETRKLCKASRKRAEAMSQLAQILCDLGETSRRVRQFEDTNPYRLLIDGMMNRGSSESDSRQYWDS
jgi:hypothetical protein